MYRVCLELPEAHALTLDSLAHCSTAALKVATFMGLKSVGEDTIPECPGGQCPLSRKGAAIP